MPVLNANGLSHFPTSSHKFEAGVYVHWPFCERKCPYCDFNSHVRERVDQKAWLNAMLTEIDTFAANFPNMQAKSIFFGGGTPSLMPPATTAAIIERIRKHWKPSGDIEITLEANPSSIEAARFKGYADAGVNRVSIGIQSLKDSSLKFLGRLHSAEEALSALKVARNNFERVSFDMIYALPEQSLEDWRLELQQALSFSPSHVSLYQLTIEEGTAFYHQYKRGKFTLPDEDLAASMFEMTQDITEQAGLPAYEISNHARKGEESQHNLVYWRGEPYVGIGPGAHGRLSDGYYTLFAYVQKKRPEEWLDNIKKHRHGTDTIEDISFSDYALESLMMGIRLREGIDLSSIGQSELASGEHKVINHDVLNDLILSGHIHKVGERIMLTKSGRPLLNFLLRKLIA